MQIAWLIKVWIILWIQIEQTVDQHMLLFSITKIRINDIASMSLYLCHSHHPRWPSAAVAVASTSWTQSEADRQQRTEGLAHSPKGPRLHKQTALAVKESEGTTFCQFEWNPTGFSSHRILKWCPKLIFGFRLHWSSDDYTLNWHYYFSLNELCFSFIIDRKSMTSIFSSNNGMLIWSCQRNGNMTHKGKYCSFLLQMYIFVFLIFYSIHVLSA